VAAYPIGIPVPAKISLEKRIGDAAPKLVSLAKKAQISLEKANLTMGHFSISDNMLNTEDQTK
jgi:hypothetical protein